MLLKENRLIYDIDYRFYLECMLPEIISPLYKLRQQVTDIREPLYIKEAQKNKKSSVKKNRCNKNNNKQYYIITS